jgi:hypothetical protein
MGFRLRTNSALFIIGVYQEPTKVFYIPVQNSREGILVQNCLWKITSDLVRLELKEKLGVDVMAKDLELFLDHVIVCSHAEYGEISLVTGTYMLPEIQASTIDTQSMRKFAEILREARGEMKKALFKVSQLLLGMSKQTYSVHEGKS